MDAIEPLIRWLLDVMVRWLTAPIDAWVVLLIVFLFGLLISYTSKRGRDRTTRRINHLSREINHLSREIEKIEREDPKPSRWTFD